MADRSDQVTTFGPIRINEGKQVRVALPPSRTGYSAYQFAHKRGGRSRPFKSLSNLAVRLHFDRLAVIALVISVLTSPLGPEDPGLEVRRHAEDDPPAT
jgi:hypothetical protein